jgi:hypothetical protein
MKKRFDPQFFIICSLSILLVGFVALQSLEDMTQEPELAVKPSPAFHGANTCKSSAPDPFITTAEQAAACNN